MRVTAGWVQLICLLIGGGGASCCCEAVKPPPELSLAEVFGGAHDQATSQDKFAHPKAAGGLIVGGKGANVFTITPLATVLGFQGMRVIGYVPGRDLLCLPEGVTFDELTFSPHDGGTSTLVKQGQYGLVIIMGIAYTDVDSSYFGCLPDTSSSSSLYQQQHQQSGRSAASPPSVSCDTRHPDLLLPAVGTQEYKKPSRLGLTNGDSYVVTRLHNSAAAMPGRHSCEESTCTGKRAYVLDHSSTIEKSSGGGGRVYLPDGMFYVTAGLAVRKAAINTPLLEQTYHDVCGQDVYIEMNCIEGEKKVVTQCFKAVCAISPNFNKKRKGNLRGAR